MHFSSNVRSATARPGCLARRGVAAVEFAFVAPLLVLVVLGTIEFGRAMMVSELLTNTVRAGCRQGTLPGTTNADVNAIITNSLTSISGTTTTIQVNGANADVSSAAPGDTVSVQISVPYQSVSWLPKNSYLGSVTLSAKAAMPHE